MHYKCYANIINAIDPTTQDDLNEVCIMKLYTQTLSRISNIDSQIYGYYL
jgi:hypothetical protein